MRAPAGGRGAPPTVMGYDAYYVALEALKAAGSTKPADVMAVLGGVELDGVSGPNPFDDVVCSGSR